MPLTDEPALQCLLDAGQTRGWQDPDGFYGRFARASLEMARRLGSPPTDADLTKLAARVKRRFLAVNLLTPAEFVQIVVPQYRFCLETRAEHIEGRADSPLHLSVDQIDSFREAGRITAAAVASLVPLAHSEDDIQRSIEQILGEPTREQDWGGERSDIFTRHVILEGQRVPAAFLLKGPAVKGTLYPAKLGKRGDQAHRLFQEPAVLFVIQYVGRIDSTIDQLAHALASQVVQPRRTIAYCIIDGTDTARLLVAYGCVCERCGALLSAGRPHRCVNARRLGNRMRRS